MARATLGVGIVGLSASGGWAGAAHVPAIRAVDGLELRAVAASTAKSAQAAAAAHEVPHASRSVAELTARDDVDLVVVAVRVPLHHEIVMPALASGKAVLCEWPLARTLGEAQEMTGAATGPAFVGLQGRSAPVTRFLRDLISAGQIGEVQSMNVIGCAPPWGDPTDPRNRYILDRENGATMLSIPFSHTFDTVESVVGDFTSVTGTTALRRHRVPSSDGGELPMTAEDQAAASGRLASGALGAIHYRGGSVPTPRFRWEIQGAEGSLEVVNDASTVNRGDVAIREHRPGLPVRDVPLPDAYDAFPELRGTQAHVVAHAYASIVRDLEEGTDVAPRFTDALRLHEILDLIEAASRDQAAVPTRHGEH